MQVDPFVERQRLSDTYREMADEELLQLAGDSFDLTEVAREVLGNEMRTRHLRLPGPGAATSPDAKQGDGAEVPEDDHPDYTWKTPLTECETKEQAQDLVDALKNAGIDAWLEASDSGSRYAHFTLDYPRVLVAADQLDQARAIAAQPLPPHSKSDDEVDEAFAIPKCPRCGTEDPILEGVSPVNTWRCENCGNQWSETPVESPETPAPSVKG